MERKAKAKFIIVNKKTDYFTGFRFLEYELKEIIKNCIEYDIPDEKFNHTNNVLPVEIELFNKNDSKKFIIHIYKCDNVFYIYLKRSGITYEFLLLEGDDFKNLKSDKIGYECDSNGNQHRVRITMINYNEAEIYFGDLPIIPNIFITPNIKLCDEEITSLPKLYI